MRFWLLFVLCAACAAQTLPDAPSAVHRSEPAHFFTFRTWSQPALKPDKKCWAILVGTHALAWTALAVANHRKESWGSEGPALAGFSAG